MHVADFESRNPLWEETYRKICVFECPPVLDDGAQVGTVTGNI